MKKGLMLIVVMVVLLMLGACQKETIGKDTEITGMSEPTDVSNLTPTTNLTKVPVVSKVKVGDYITFGHYEQDYVTRNGSEAIEWLVLAMDGNKALVISKYCLDTVAYNERDVDITWEYSLIREWLNNEFYNTAFNASEQVRIENTYVVNDDNPEKGTEGGNDTWDKVFLLSIEEVERYFLDNDSMCAKGTVYAEEKGLSLYDYNWSKQRGDGEEYAKYDGSAYWWLRSPGWEGYRAAFLSTYDGVSNLGEFVDDNEFGVRPAMWINLEGEEIIQVLTNKEESEIVPITKIRGSVK